MAFSCVSLKQTKTENNQINQSICAQIIDKEQAL